VLSPLRYDFGPLNVISCEVLRNVGSLLLDGRTCDNTENGLSGSSNGMWHGGNPSGTDRRCSIEFCCDGYWNMALGAGQGRQFHATKQYWVHSPW